MDDFGKKVWVPHPVDGFKLGKIIDIGPDGVTVDVLERPPGQKLSAPFESVFPAEDNDSKDVEDNCMILLLLAVLLYIYILKSLLWSFWYFKIVYNVLIILLHNVPDNNLGAKAN